MQLTDDQMHRIYRSIDLSPDRKIVLLDVYDRPDISNSDADSNIYCISPSGSVHWQVLAASANSDRNPFVGIYHHDDESIKAARSDGNVFVLNASTGVGTHVGWRK